MTTRLILLFIFMVGTTFADAKKSPTPPNVILVITDDQGSGDLSCNGNPWLKTPNIDQFSREAVRLTDFHVSPLCAPTRSAIMTGRYPINNGVWATFKGRDALSDKTITLAEIFKRNGYTTAMFGKWHLGDNYPVRPSDCGFDYAINHKGGGVGELSDYWGNNYFNDVYFVNNNPQQFNGYCTDIWFSEAMKFISNNKDKPFFIYLPTNAPHSPWHVAERYAEPYQKLEEEHKIVSANFYGMIANLDENMGHLNHFLKKNNLEKNTIVIFMTDNGSSGGISRDGKIGYNYGFRGMKGGKTEGGHRVPFFIRWPQGHIGEDKEVNALTTHVDIMPTLASLCHLSLPEALTLDGIDFSALLRDPTKQLPKRTVFVHHRQDWRPPMDEDQTCLLNGNWRLVNGDQLYNIENDRHQDHNLADNNPQMVKKLLSDNEFFLKIAKQNRTYNQFPVSRIGNNSQDEIKLTIQHAIGEDPGIWKAEQVAAGMKNRNNTHAIEIEQEGTYEIRCCRWPQECPGPIWGIPAQNPKDLYTYQTIKPEKVRLSIANQMHEKKIEGNENAIVFKVRLEKGKTLLVNNFIEGQESYGVYYTYIKYLNK